MLPCPQCCGYHQVRCRCHWIAPLRGCATDGKGFQHGPSNAVEEQPQIKDNFRAGVHVHTLPPAHQIMGAGRVNVVHAPPREGGLVLDGLHSGDEQPYIPKSFHPVPPAQLGPIHVYWVPTRSRLTGAYRIPGKMPSVPSMPPATSDPGRPVVCRPEAGDYQAASQGSTS